MHQRSTIWLTALLRRCLCLASLERVSSSTVMSAGRSLCGVFIGAFILGMVVPSAAQAAFGISAFDGAALGRDGGAFPQAGGHADALTTTFDMNITHDTTGSVMADGGALKNVHVDLPSGLIGNPTAVGKCTMGAFLKPISDVGAYRQFCPGSAQVGNVGVRLGFGSSSDAIAGPLPVFSLEPSPGAVASFGFIVALVPVFLDAYVTSEQGYHVTVVVRDTSEALAVLGSSVKLWGLPADPLHDAERICQGTTSVGCATESSSTPFVTNPTYCPAAGTGLETRLRVDSWAKPGVFAQASFVSHDPPGYTLDNPLPLAQWGATQGTTGCDQLPFDPSMSVKLDSTSPDAPAGLAVDLSLPQDGLENQNGLATAHLKRVRVTLPSGLTISPSLADGLAGCSDIELGLGTDSAVHCPEASKIGTVSATTPVLDEPIEGGVYVGTQKSDDPASGQMFRIFLVLENEQRGLRVKLEGQVRVKNDGQIETAFENNPQLPVSTISLRLKSGPRAPLATPWSCGVHTVDAELTSWAGQRVNLKDSFIIDCPADLGKFSPSFDAGTVDPKGGAFSPFVVRVDRPDRQQYLAGVELDTPDGLLAKLKGVPLCGETQAATGTCPLQTRVGTATVGAGPGSNPFFLRGSVSLTEPYRGAPYGLSVAVRVIAGSFDLGTVVVRQAIFVNPVDAHLTVISDPLPLIFKGVPIRLRSVNVDIDRPGFTMNPSSCAQQQINATLTSSQGVIARPSTRFQSTECALLGFRPKLSLRLTGQKQTTDGKHPGLKAVLIQPRHQAGIRGVTVVLPLSLALDPEHAVSDTLCEFEEGQKPNPKCPDSSIIGKAVARTPLLNQPLAGNVYFVKNVRIDNKTGRRIRTLPTLLVALRGEVALNLRAKTSIKNGKLASTFTTVPDAPVTRFDLTLTGGRKGILVINGNICKRKQRARTAIVAQNGKSTIHNNLIDTSCIKRR
jgi:hypothetical protein